VAKYGNHPVRLVRWESPADQRTAHAADVTWAGPPVDTRNKGSLGCGAASRAKVSVNRDAWRYFFFLPCFSFFFFFFYVVFYLYFHILIFYIYSISFSYSNLLFPLFCFLC